MILIIILFFIIIYLTGFALYWVLSVDENSRYEKTWFHVKMWSVIIFWPIFLVVELIRILIDKLK